MKKFTLLLILWPLLFPALANGDDSVSPLEDIHLGPERNFDELMKAVVEVRTQRGYGTGTLFIKDGKYYVLTAAHVVTPYDNEVMIVTVRNSNEELSASVVYQSDESDVAILAVKEMVSRTPIKLKFRRNPIEVGNQVGYCGFPNRLDLACFSGRVSFIREDMINIHSYTWSGASGSLVMDKKGRAIGILSAFEMGGFMGLPEPIQNIVWLTPIQVSILDQF